MGLGAWVRERRAGAAAVTELLQTSDALAAGDSGLRRGDVTTVLAAVDHSDGHAALVLADLGLDRGAVVTAARVATAGVPGGHPDEGGDDKSLLWRTSELSKQHLGGAVFSSALVLVAAAGTAGGPVATLVDRLGVDRPSLRHAALARAQRPAPPAS